MTRVLGFPGDGIGAFSLGTFVQQEANLKRVFQDVACSGSATASRHPEDRFDDAIAEFRDTAPGRDYPTFLIVPAYARCLVEPRERELAVGG